MESNRSIKAGESPAGPFRGLIDTIINERRLHTLRNVFETPQRQGSLEGLEMCKRLRDGDILDFDLSLFALSAEAFQNRIALEAGEIARSEVTRQRFRLVQVQNCFNILRVAYFARHGERYEGLSAPVFDDVAEHYNQLADEAGLQPVEMAAIY